MKNLLFISLTAAVILSACQSVEQTDTISASTVETVVNRIETDGPSKYIANLAIEGMGCEMACGSAIKKSLSGLDGVKVTEIDFDSEKEIDYAIVEYDNTKVSSEEMVKAVNELRKGHYKVSGVVIDEYVSGENATPAANETTKEAAKTNRESSLLEKKIDTRSITLPNILEILNRF